MTQPCTDAANDVAVGTPGRKPDRARFALRERTRAEHEATEAAFAPFDLTVADDYRQFLIAHAMALPRLELGVTGLGWTGWQPRYHLLADDLAALGAFLPAPMIAPAISPVSAWGVQYVLEGSKLGGTVLSGRLPAGVPARYLRPAPDMPVRWQAFCAALDAAAANGGPEWMNEVIDSAIETFQAFRRSADALAGDLS
ncbi:biliverdin-producing heme oxygenase [Croceicoccus bisphenolivorans]|uniref:biliverdin-producing heme oxygenase n=1 Tax=Croceicoccus bisphenolivorans TaxID=1783232 RepID=UPI0009EE7F87|nr:biliverdin-producing heme oxygenase [Croceicoccus bisphenolivorans]